MAIQSHKDLIVWQKSMQLVKEIYIFTEKFPQDEQFGLVSQMRRAAVSIPSNIAEGYRRRSMKDYVRFLSIADGSSAELETQLILCRDIFGKESSKIYGLLGEVQKMLITLIKKLKA